MKDEDWVDAAQNKIEECKNNIIKTYEKGITMDRCHKCGKIIQEIGYDPDAAYRNESLKQREQRKGYDGKMEFDLG